MQSSVVHFQLRHLLWATSGVDVYVQNNNTISHWNLATRTETKVLLNTSAGCVYVTIITLRR